MTEIVTTITKIASLAVLAVALWQARRLASDVFSNIEQFGKDEPSKYAVSRRAMADFYLAFAAMVVLIAGVFDKLNDQLFAVLLVAVLAGLGIKITTDIKKG